MFDELCSALRDVIHDAIDESINGFTEVECLLAERNVDGVTMTFTDDGLAIAVGEELYSISIQKV